MPTKQPRVDEEQFVLDSVSQLKAIADPQRLQILLLLADAAMTVKEVAAALDAAPTRLYYHFKILERNGLIRVTERRVVSGIEERTYRAVATSWTVAPSATGSLVKSGVLAALLGVVRAELGLALGAGASTPLGDPGSPVPAVSFTRLAIPDDRMAEAQALLISLMEDYGDTGQQPPEVPRYHSFLTVYRAPGELKEVPPRPAKRKKGSRAP